MKIGHAHTLPATKSSAARRLLSGIMEMSCVEFPFGTPKLENLMRKAMDIGMEEDQISGEKR
jgi:hypothetical protein